MNPEIEFLSQDQVRDLRKLGRLSLTVLFLGMCLLGVAFWLGIARGRELERQAEQDRKLAEREAVAAKTAKTHASELAAFVEGRSPSVFTQGVPSVAEKLHPTATLTQGIGTVRFKLGVNPEPSISGLIKSVQYRLDPKLYATNVYEGVAPSYSAEVLVATCRSTVSADVELSDGRVTTVTFDWCQLSGWRDQVIYDSSRVQGAAELAPNCVATRALLFEVNKEVFNRIGPVQILKQLYRADRRWQPTSQSTPVTFVAQHRIGNESDLALVAKCRQPETCVSLAAAYAATARTAPPLVVCGAIRGFDKEEIPLPQLRDGVSPVEFEARAGWEKCFRLSACEVARFGATNDYPTSTCVRTDAGVPQALLECSAQTDCDSVLACAKAARR